MDIIESIKMLISGLLNEKNYELVDIMYHREGGRMVLRLLIDKEGGITIDECAFLNNEIGKALDGADVIPERYVLEVNSPGLDRPLKTRRDFERVIGKEIRLHTYEPVNDNRDHWGVIISVDDKKVNVGGSEIALDKISKAKLKIDF